MNEVYNKEEFIKALTSLSKEELNEIIAKNGKQKVVKPFKPIKSKNK